MTGEQDLLKRWLLVSVLPHFKICSLHIQHICFNILFAVHINFGSYLLVFFQGKMDLKSLQQYHGLICRKLLPWQGIDCDNGKAVKEWEKTHLWQKCIKAQN